MKIRLVALLAVVALSIMAVPASAHTGVGVLQGTAEVTALGLPVVHGNVSGTWKLSGTVTGTDSGTLSVAGDLGPNAAGVGASCGMSKGVNGNGTFDAASGLHTISGVTWETSAGGTIAAVGSYSGHSAGTVIALVQAQGGAANCANGTADEFQVVGAAALI